MRRAGRRCRDSRAFGDVVLRVRWLWLPGIQVECLVWHAVCPSGAKQQVVSVPLIERGGLPSVGFGHSLDRSNGLGAIDLRLRAAVSKVARVSAAAITCQVK